MNSVIFTFSAIDTAPSPILLIDQDSPHDRDTEILEHVSEHTATPPERLSLQKPHHDDTGTIYRDNRKIGQYYLR